MPCIIGCRSISPYAASRSRWRRRRRREAEQREKTPTLPSWGELPIWGTRRSNFAAGSRVPRIAAKCRLPLLALRSLNFFDVLAAFRLTRGELVAAKPLLAPLGFTFTCWGADKLTELHHDDAEHSNWFNGPSDHCGGPELECRGEASWR